jgi:hypothetical protein
MVGPKGYAVFAKEDGVRAWALAAYFMAQEVLRGPVERRHGGTWCVGVDALPNAPDGSVHGVPLEGAWQTHVESPASWHRAQLSVVFPGYPGKDSDESDAAHKYRRSRDAAHVDGLLPEGPKRRRHLREPHGFVLGLPLNAIRASPLVVWEGSHLIMQDVFRQAFQGIAPETYGDVDVTDAYQAARRAVFTTCPRRPIHAEPGQSILLHRHLLHGVAPWDGPDDCEGRMVAYFRPLIPPAQWLAPARH